MPYCGKRLNRGPWGWKSKRWSTAALPENEWKPEYSHKKRQQRQLDCFGEIRDSEFYKNRREQKRKNALHS